MKKFLTTLLCSLQNRSNFTKENIVMKSRECYIWKRKILKKS